MPATGAVEWSLLLAVCSSDPTPEKSPVLQTLLGRPLQWKLLFDLAGRHGVQPLLYQALSRSEDAIPAEAMQALTQIYQTNLRKALLLSRELIRIVGRLTALGIDVIPYKGVALAETIYGDIALRQSGDIDLLIRARDLPRLRTAVGELGYTPHLTFSEPEERAYLKSGYEYAFDGAAGPNLLELQWAIQPRFYAVDIDMNGLFQRAVTIPVAGQPMQTLGLEDLFLVLALHAAKHVWGRLVWLCDLARLMRSPNLDWERIGVQARNLGVARILRVSLLLAHRMLGAAIPSTAEKSLPEDRAALPLAEEIEGYVASETAFNVESLSYFRLMLRLRERAPDRMRFLHRLVSTPGPGEWNAVRLPGPLFPLYRLVRLSRVTARLIRRV